MSNATPRRNPTNLPVLSFCKVNLHSNRVVEYQRIKGCEWYAHGRPVESLLLESMQHTNKLSKEHEDRKSYVYLCIQSTQEEELTDVIIRTMLC